MTSTDLKIAKTNAQTQDRKTWADLATKSLDIAGKVGTVALCNPVVSVIGGLVLIEYLNNKTYQYKPDKVEVDGAGNTTVYRYEAKVLSDTATRNAALIIEGNALLQAFGGLTSAVVGAFKD